MITVAVWREKLARDFHTAVLLLAM